MKFEQDIDLIEALASIYPGSKRNTLRKMLTTGRVTVDGTIIHKAKHLVTAGSTVAVSNKDIAAPEFTPSGAKKETFSNQNYF